MPADWAGAAILAAVVASVFAGVAGLWAGAGAVVLAWVRRAAEHPGPVVLLLPVDPTTRWWTYSSGFEVTLIGSRLHFNESATYARQTLCIWRKGLDKASALARLRAAEARAERYRGALERYGRHRPDCRTFYPVRINDPMPVCDCGWDVARSLADRGDA